MAKEQDTQQIQSDLVYTSNLTRQLTNLTGMVRDLLIYARGKSKGIDVEFMRTGNPYIDEIQEIIENLAD